MGRLALLEPAVPELHLLGPESTAFLRRAERRLVGLVRSVRDRTAGDIVREEASFVSTVGYRIHAEIWRPREPGVYPGVVLCSDGAGDVAAAQSTASPVTAPELARRGIVVLAFDPAGRGQSWGEDDFGGPEHHDNAACAVRALAGRDDVREVGLLGLGLGAPVAIGAAASGVDVAWVVDWEGPVDRETLVSVCPDAPLGADDETWWRDRDTLAHLTQLRCGYVRLQSEDDHANPEELRHAQRALHAVHTAAPRPEAWFQINHHPRGEAPARPLWLLPGQGAARQTILRKVARLVGEGI